jgi:acyl-CoA thioesterase YciA
MRIGSVSKASATIVAVDLSARFPGETPMSNIAKDPAIRLTMLPRDTNGMGSIFGGVILSYIDLAGGIEARKIARKVFVTKAMHEVIFVSPVFVGDTVSFYTRVMKTGRTSVTIECEVEVERYATGERVQVTTANITYVAVDDSRQPVSIRDEV